MTCSRLLGACGDSFIGVDEEPVRVSERQDTFDSRAHCNNAHRGDQMLRLEQCAQPAAIDERDLAEVLRVAVRWRLPAVTRSSRGRSAKLARQHDASVYQFDSESV
jgi:hypothetical protein